MKCKRCNSIISTNHKTCPLCQNDLIKDGTDAENVFPVVKLGSKKEKIFINLMTLSLFSASVICVMMNISFFNEVFWSLFVVAGAACLWTSLVIAFRVRRHLPQAIFWEVLLIAGFAVIWDIGTGSYGWSINYVIPIIFSGAIIVIWLVSTILKMAFNDYIVYLIVNGVLGIIPLIFILTHMIDVVVPSMICVSVSLIALAALFVFDRQQLIEEIHRRTHI